LKFHDLFAELVAAIVLAPKKAQLLFPKGTEYVATLIEEAGGKNWFERTETVEELDRSRDDGQG
tara:strand:+ start:2270 stop:2461 length:192 start_codon:yes stop_codon:yes gene_type:complete